MFASFMATINYMKENENLTRQKKVLPMLLARWEMPVLLSLTTVKSYGFGMGQASNTTPVE